MYYANYLCFTSICIFFATYNLIWLYGEVVSNAFVTKIYITFIFCILQAFALFSLLTTSPQNKLGVPQLKKM